MSRVGKLPVKVPSKVNVSIEDDVIVKEKGCELISREVPVKLDEVEQLSSF